MVNRVLKAAITKLQKAIKKQNLTKNPDDTYSSIGNVTAKPFIKDGKLIIQFKEVGGNFYCADNQLATLEGCPQKVGGDFSCRNNQLITLEGSPQSVGGYFYCSDNKLTTLEGSPQTVGGGFYCSLNQLTTLEGSPQKIGGSFYCSNNPVSEEELYKTVDRDYLNEYKKEVEASNLNMRKKILIMD